MEGGAGRRNYRATSVTSTILEGCTLSNLPASVAESVCDLIRLLLSPNLLSQVSTFLCASGPSLAAMPISAVDLEAAIRAAMPVIHLEIEDTSNGCGENYAVFVVSEVRLM